LWSITVSVDAAIWGGTVPRTEQRTPAGAFLDTMTSIDGLRALNEEDRAAVDAVSAALADVARLVDLAAQRVRAGGRTHYFGAGTSGRLGVLDAAELRPTFNLPHGLVVAHIAGGVAAITEAIENAEDSTEAGEAAAGDVGPNDVAIGITASGATAFVGGALVRARKAGALTALVACNANPALASYADITIVADTGPEVLTGSTRLKAGTAEKLILNGFSTALMVALGRTWNGLMVDMVATNAKLRRRAIRILADALGVDAVVAADALAHADGDLKAAIVSGLEAVGVSEARRAIQAANGSVARALDDLRAADAREPDHHTA
jgi:N-acetylmuramic acid 6-phosphate etherase